MNNAVWSYPNLNEAIPLGPNLNGAIANCSKLIWSSSSQPGRNSSPGKNFMSSRKAFSLYS